VDGSGAAAPAILVNIVFLNYLIGANGGDPDKIATRQILAVDHLMFVGVLTNGIFALLRRATAGDDRWPTADHVVFFGMNGGLVGFVLAFLSNNVTIERISTPIMGASILLGLAVAAARLRRGATLSVPAPA